MATYNPIANLFRSSQALDRGTLTHAAERAATSSVAVMDRDLHAVREIPHERIYFYTKNIDNSGVVKEVNRGAEAMSWKTIAGACASAVLLIGLLIPVSSNVLAGYRVHSLQQETRSLLEERAGLELEEAKLLAPERLAELARMQNFIEANKSKVIYSNPKAGEAVARLTPAAPALLAK